LLKANALYMIGCIQEKLGRCDQALISLKEALAFHKKIGGLDHIDVARTLRRLGTVHQARRECSQSLSCLKESLRIGIDQLGSRHLEVAQTYEYLSDTLSRELRYDESVYYINEAISIHESREHSLVLARCYALKGVLLDQIGGDLEVTISSYTQSKKIYSSILEQDRCTAETQSGYMSFASVVFKLAMVQERSGNLRAATSEYSREFVPTPDAMLSIISSHY